MQPGRTEPDATPDGPGVPAWALLSVTWLNSLGSGILWSGVPFVTERQFGFTQTENLLLALAESVIYVAMALGSGPALRALAARGVLTARGWLASVFVVQLGASLLTLAGARGVVAAACVLSALGAALWPVMESYVSAGRHGGDMRRSIGRFNVTWMSATAASLFLMAPLVARGDAAAALLVMVPVSLASLALLRWFPRLPAAHAAEHAHTHIAPQYPFLLLATRFLIPASYVLIAVIGPVLPFLVRDLGVDDSLKTPLAATWMVSRAVTVLFLGGAGFWHGRWGTLVAGLALLGGGFAAAVLAGNVPLAAVGLAAFGAGHGILYLAGLYYAMSVGGAEVDAGGRFEALIGVGYVVGPVAALAVGGTPAGLVAGALLTAAAGALPAAGPYLAWRLARQGGPR